MRRHLLFACYGCLALLCREATAAEDAFENIKAVPPPGIAIPDTDRDQLQKGVSQLGKQLELLTEIVPRASQIAVPWNPNSPDTKLAFKETQGTAKAQKLKLLSLTVQRGEDFDSAFQEASKHRPDALIVLQDALTFTNRKMIADLAAKRRLPAIFGLTEAVEAGGLMADGPNRAANSKHSTASGKLCSTE